jgi:hypothetical protein
MKGSCVCGQIILQITAQINKLYQCHCNLCQKQTGTAAATACFINSEHFKWVAGADKITLYTKDSGYCSAFCSCCGALVPNIFRKANKMWVPAGALDGKLITRVTEHIFVANKAAWDEIGGDGIQYADFHPVYA